jgi:hypothetical protein
MKHGMHCGALMQRREIREGARKRVIERCMYCDLEFEELRSATGALLQWVNPVAKKREGKL